MYLLFLNQRLKTFRPVFHKGQRVRNLTPENCKFLGSSCVSALYEDKYANCWVGTRGSLGVQLADGNSFLFENMSFVDGAQLNWFYVRDIIAVRRDIPI